MSKNILIIVATKMELPVGNKAFVVGVGKERAQKNVRNLIEKQHPDLVISLGLVGAVIPELSVGDIFIPEKVVDYNNPVISYEIEYPIEKKGILVTVHKVFGKDDKLELKNNIPGAFAVDMETTAVSQVLKPLDIPLICIKSVSDDLHFSFDSLNREQLFANIKKAVKNYSDYLTKFLENIS